MATKTLSLAPVPTRPLVPPYMSSHHRDLLQRAQEFRASVLPLPGMLSWEIRGILRGYLEAGPCHPHFYRTIELLADERTPLNESPELFRRRIEELYRDSPPRVVFLHMQALKRTYPLAAVLVPPGAWEGM